MKTRQGGWPYWIQSFRHTHILLDNKNNFKNMTEPKGITLASTSAIWSLCLSHHAYVCGSTGPQIRVGWSFSTNV